MRKQQHVDAVAKASRQTISALMQDLFNNIEHTVIKQRVVLRSVCRPAICAWGKRQKAQHQPVLRKPNAKDIHMMPKLLRRYFLREEPVEKLIFQNHVVFAHIGLRVPFARVLAAYRGLLPDPVGGALKMLPQSRGTDLMLEQIVLRAKLKHLPDVQIVVTVAQRKHRQPVRQVGKMLHQLHTVHNRHQNIRDHNINWLCCKNFQRLRAVGRLRAYQKLAAALVDQLFQIAAKPQFVVHDHHIIHVLPPPFLFSFLFLAAAAPLSSRTRRSGAPRHTARHSKF